MKKAILILLFLFSIVIKAQKKEKDTLFFSIDKYYTISPTITPNLSKQTYPESVEAEREQMKHTQTNGYIYFVGDGYLTKNLKPKNILSIKDYIENRKFYFDGIHNKIIDNQKLKDSLTDKYTLFFVNGDEFIQPRHLGYVSYYPLRDKDRNVIKNKVKDTLFFKYDKKYIITHTGQIPSHFYLNDSSTGSNGTFFFEEREVKNNLNPPKKLSLKKFIRSLDFYDKKKKLNDEKLDIFFSNYVVFLVKTVGNKKEYIRVESALEIE